MIWVLPIHALERCDLDFSNIEFETTWIEIKKRKSKNIMWKYI